MLVWSPENQDGGKMSEGAIFHRYNKEYDSGKYTLKPFSLAGC